MATKRAMLNGLVNRISAVGIELEGGWDVRVPGHEVIRDGSVNIPIRQDQGPPDPRTGVRPIRTIGPQYGIGEVVSQPMPTSAIADWVRMCYPQHTNETCGLHVHMSFSHKLHYGRLMTPEYTDAIVRAVREFGQREGLTSSHPLWGRVDNPQHPHCAHQYLGDKQVLVRKKDYQSRGKDYSRYTVINYCEGLHPPKPGSVSGTGTLECRLLPMFETAEMAIRAIMVVLDTTNRFLAKTRQMERAAAVAVKARPEVYQEYGVNLR